MRLKTLTDPGQLGRYRDIALLLVRHGRAGLLEPEALDDLLERTHDAPIPPTDESAPEDLADDLQRLGPTFVKLGQLLSTRPDLLSAPYLRALERLQDDLEPFDFGTVREIVEDELGVRLSKAFASFEERPYGAASLAQVHRATLRDGRRVAVKVLRPGIRTEVGRDLEALRTITGWLDEHSDTARRYNVASIQMHFEATLRRELDLRREAANLEQLAQSLSRFPRIEVPAPILDYTTSRVLTMTYVDGTKIDRLSSVVHTDLPGPDLARELFRAYLHQVLVDGMFHADPHPGNVLLTRDHRIALIDLGMVGHVPEDEQQKLLRLLLALAERNGSRAADMALALSEPTADCDETEFRHAIADLVMTEPLSSIQQLRPGRLLMDVCRVAARTGIRLPVDLAVLAKTLLNLDQIGLALDREFDPAAEIQRASDELMRQRIGSDVSQAKIFSTLLDTKDFAARLPDRMSRILETLAANRLRLDVDAIDETRLIRGLGKVANRITAGLILASLIVGAALLMRVETDFTLLGYPGLAIILFLLAATGGVKLLFDVMHDED